MSARRHAAISSLAVGTHSITAVYSGDASNNGSTSSALSQVVHGAGSTTSIGTSLNPSTAGTSVTFTATVTATAPTGTVNFKDGASSITGCSAISITGSGNVRTAQCATSALAVGTHSITAVYSGDANNAGSTSSALSQVVNASGGSVNVAFAANGGSASASSTYVASGYSFAVSGVINGDRAGLNWQHGGGWNSAPPAFAYPQWAQINFNGQKTINQVIVYTVQDNYTNPVDPPANLTFTLYGLTAFQVQGWNGAAWVNLGAAVAGNNLVKRAVNFAAFTTNAIRVNVTGAVDGYARITEIEAWTGAGGGPTASTTTLTSSLNPSTAGTSVTFTATVTATAPTGTVNFKDGASSITGCSAISITGSGNVRTAQCATSALAVGTHSIVASYGGDANNAASTSAPSRRWSTAAPRRSTWRWRPTVARPRRRAPTSRPAYSFAVSGVINGDRAGLNWQHGGGWNSAPPAVVYPQWVQINFNGQKTINQVIVYTVQDN